MNSHSNSTKDQLVRTAEFLTEDIESMSNADVKMALDESGLALSDAQALVKRASESAKRRLGSIKLAAAKQALKKHQKQPAKIVDIDGIRAKEALKSYWEKHPESAPTTMAARKGVQLSDDTAIKMFQALVDLGAISPDDESADD